MPNFITRWWARRKIAKENEAIGQIYNYLSTEVKDAEELKTLLKEIQANITREELAHHSKNDEAAARLFREREALCIQFKQKLEDFKNFDRAIEKIGKKYIEKTMFKDLVAKE